MLFCGFRLPILGHFVNQQLKLSQRNLAGEVLAEDGKHVLVEHPLHILSHLLAPGSRFYGRERLPTLGKTLDGLSLVDELACVIFDVFRSFCCASCFGIVAGPRVFSFFLRTAFPEGPRRRDGKSRARPSLRAADPIFLIQRSCASLPVSLSGCACGRCREH
jgi:hypothetical protein